MKQMTPDKGYGEYQVPTAPEGKALTKFFAENMTFFFKSVINLIFWSN